ncbi:AEC family transporter [uncultured Sutterella sp.]|uniref:AEC family transporter n=1 Tax=uncultured Sutterella sp. TaxID=286133 RepID=UPI00266D785B|nr:AEC family transporter [uncultured Sutterella sp.]MBS5217081.1 AEC family transporter [Sutterella wadsworthensis]
MYSISLIIPDFAIILLGLVLSRKGGFTKAFWDGAEKLVFNFLLAPFLFVSVAQSQLAVGESVRFLLTGICAMLLGVAASFAVRYFIKADAVTHASVFQCGFRFNTYIGFAICTRFCGAEGPSLLAMLIAFWVPISNSIAVSDLVRAVAKRDNQSENRSQLLRTTVLGVARNPLIIATVLGLIFNYLGIELIQPVKDFLSHLGSASLAMGLLCIGAGLQFSNLAKHFKLIAASCLVRLAVVPLMAWIVIQLTGLSGNAAAVVLVFASLPTAQSCYVMTANMHGNASIVAAVTTLQTLLSMLTLSILIALQFT